MAAHRAECLIDLSKIAHQYKDICGCDPTYLDEATFRSAARSKDWQDR
jgi:hypothetical protein